MFLWGEDPLLGEGGPGGARDGCGAVQGPTLVPPLIRRLRAAPSPRGRRGAFKNLPQPGFPRMGEKAIVYQFRFFLPITVIAPRDRTLRASRPAASSGKEGSPVLGLVVSIFFHLA